MGCGGSVLARNNRPMMGTTSFKQSINRDRSNREQFILKQRHADEHERDIFVKTSGQIDGEQFIVEDCSHMGIFLMDNIEALTVDVGNRLVIVTGPIEGSVFLRDCVGCDFFIACQQFRMRNCKDCRVHLFCTASPIVESSTNIGFSCLQLSYFDFESQFEKSSLNIWRNKWYDVYDFTPSNGNFHLFNPSRQQYEAVITNYFLKNESAVSILRDGGYLVPSETGTASELIPMTYGPVLADVSKAAQTWSPEKWTPQIVFFTVNILMASLAIFDNDLRTMATKLYFSKEVSKFDCMTRTSYLMLDKTKFNQMFDKNDLIGLRSYLKDNQKTVNLSSISSKSNTSGKGSPRVVDISDGLYWIFTESELMIKNEDLLALNENKPLDVNNMIPLLKKYILVNRGELPQQKMEGVVCFFGAQATDKINLVFDTWQQEVSN